MKPATFRKLLLFLVSTLVTLVAAEFLLRASSKYFLQIFDTEMWRYAREVKTESPLPGFVEDHLPNAEGYLMGVRIRTDASGFRWADPDTESRRRPNNRTVIALGDSLTLGWGVPESQTYPVLLEKMLNDRAQQSSSPGFTVLNAGIGNSNTSMELARYERNLRPLHPQWLILGYFINDPEPDPVPVRNPLVRNSALVSLIAGQLQTHASKKFKSYDAYYRSLYDDSNPGWPRMKAALSQLGQDLKQDGVRATIVLLPEMHEPKDFGPFKDLYQQVAALARAAGFEVIDASPQFPAGPGNQYWVSPSDAHPNGAAQAIVASALMQSKFVSELAGPK